MTTTNRFEYPSSKKVYGIVVRGSTTTQEIVKLLADVERSDADLVVFLSVAPHDVRQRSDWSDIQRNVRNRAQSNTHEVELIEQSDIAIAAKKISVLNG